RAQQGRAVAAPAPERRFDVQHAVTLYFEELGDGTHDAWSHGLRKFGRPDLVLLGVTAETATEAALTLRDLAATLAAGHRIEPGDSVEASDGRTLVVSRFEPETLPVVAVDGPAVVLSLV
ncbi:MAG: hypothetical protein AB7L28_28920, partial [Kofleriaceae bacterium]